MKRWWRRVRPYVLWFPVYALARAIMATVRLTVEGYPPPRNPDQGVIYAGWHGRTFLAASLFRGRGVWTLVSTSRDGEMQSRIFARFGFRIIRGSTGRGGARALLQACRVLQEGAEMAFTPDGPRGPSGVVQPGILAMAQRSGAAIVPVGVSASRRYLAPSWDRFLVPLPFSRGLMIFGSPMTVPANASSEELESLRRRLEDELHRLEREAEARMGHG